MKYGSKAWKAERVQEVELEMNPYFVNADLRLARNPPGLLFPYNPLKCVDRPMLSPLALFSPIDSCSASTIAVESNLDPKVVEMSVM